MTSYESVKHFISGNFMEKEPFTQFYGHFDDFDGHFEYFL